MTGLQAPKLGQFAGERVFAAHAVGAAAPAAPRHGRGYPRGVAGRHPRIQRLGARPGGRR